MIMPPLPNVSSEKVFLLGMTFDIHTWKLATGNRLIIFTELAENEGMSVTNAAAEIASAMVNWYNLNPLQCIFVERYTEQSYPNPNEPYEHLDMVTLDWTHDTRLNAWLASNPKWQRIPAEQLEIKTGIAL